jgi:capsule polysaccharide export protein KpsE/RkpR
LEKSKDTNTGLAFLEAGLAIMATPGGLATAIGKGAREGTAKYAAGIEKLRSAKEKLDEARDRMEELKLNRDEMSAKEEMEAKLGIQQTVISAKKDALSSAKTLYGERSALSQAIVKETLNAEEKAKDRATQERTAGAAAAIALVPQNKFIQDWLSKPENKGKSYSDAYAAFKNLGAASERNDITGLKAVQAGLIKEISENLTMTKAEKAAKQAQINEINNRILALTGAAAPSTTGGAQRTIDWNSIK